MRAGRGLWVGVVVAAGSLGGRLGAQSTGEPDAPDVRLAIETRNVEGGSAGLATFLQGEPVGLEVVLHNVTAEKIEGDQRDADMRLVSEIALGKRAQSEWPPQHEPLPHIVVPHGEECWSVALMIAVDKDLGCDDEACDDASHVSLDWLVPSAIEVQRGHRSNYSFQASQGRVSAAAAGYVMYLSPALGSTLTPGTYVVRATYDTRLGWGDATPLHVEASPARFRIRVPETPAEKAQAWVRAAQFHGRERSFAEALRCMITALAIDPDCDGGYGELGVARYEHAVGDGEAELAAYDRYIDRTVADRPPGFARIQNGVILKCRNELAAKLGRRPRAVAGVCETPELGQGW